jgi:hypothetical protein
LIRMRRRLESREQSDHKIGMSLRAAYFLLVSLVFAYTLTANVIERPGGVYISTVFVLTVLILCAISSYQRSKELRVSDVVFADHASFALWPTLVGKKVNLLNPA